MRLPDFQQIQQEHLIVNRLKKLLKGQTDDFTFTGRYLRKEVLGEKNESND